MADISKERWAWIKSLRVVPRMVHLSCECGMKVNPFRPSGPRIPWVEKPGRTLNTGRNKAKREARAKAAVFRAFDEKAKRERWQRVRASLGAA